MCDFGCRARHKPQQCAKIRTGLLREELFSASLYAIFTINFCFFKNHIRQSGNPAILFMPIPFFSLKTSQRIPIAAAVLLIFNSQTAGAQQIIDLAPARAPDAAAVVAHTRHTNDPTAALRILNMPIDSDDTPIVHLELQAAGSVTAQTRFVVIDDKGERPLHGEIGQHYSGSVAGQAAALAFVSIAPNGNIRSIINQDDKTIVSEYQPGSQTTVSATTSRSLEFARDFSHHSFQCGINELGVAAFLPRNTFTEPLTLANHPVGHAGTEQRRRADIIVDTDYEFLQMFDGNKNAAASYIADLFTYINQLYEKEINTRLNLVKVILRDTSNDPWNASMPFTNEMLQELTNYGNRPNHPEYNLPHHHVHLLSGKRDKPGSSGGIAWIDSLHESQELGYGVTAGMFGDFSPSNPQIIWDTAGLAHEIGHAFGSDHTHAFDTSYLGSRAGGAIDCCNADYGIADYGIQCQNIRKQLPGPNSLTGGVAGQRTGTIMSYCNTVNHSYTDMAWTFGTNHPYGVHPERVPQLMSGQAQKYLPVDNAAPPPPVNPPPPPPPVGNGSCQARHFTAAEERLLDLFMAYYGRPPDVGGFDWWLGELQAAGGNIYAIMERFAISPEYQRRFGHMTGSELVDNLYQQIFGRAADSDGLRIYTQELQSKRKSLVDISLVILDNTSGGDVLIIESRKTVARHYVTAVENGTIKDLAEAPLSNILNGVENPATANRACSRLGER